ncbi:MAG: TonB-dependent receptor plug [Chitinophagaceae bacterium]|nr:TonB-dependent receptor plug [Chitinophagaceae bacterium]
MRKLLLLMGILVATIQLSAQNRTVTGRVTDESGNPVQSASVTVKGSNTGTTTKNDGSFTLVVPPSARTLVITSLNYASQEAAITGSTVLVSLKSSNANLDEVVVVAYGTVKKEALTGAVGTINAEKIAKRPINNITRALEGAVAGVVTTTGSGQPGNGLNIRVRGFGSINATSEPLIVVDGVPYPNGLSNINPADVESISVLKDAGSTALYGSSAANGVVMITTKKGQRGHNNVTVRALQGIATRGLEEYERLNANQYYPIMWEAYRNGLVYPSTGTGISKDSASRVASGLTNRTSIKDLLTYNPFNVAANAIVGVDGQLNPSAKLLYPDDLDWNKDLLRRGPRQDYTVSFNGGSDRSDYFMSMGYVNEKGFTVKSDFKRYSARLNVNVQPKTWLKTGLNLSGNHTISNTAQDGSSTGFVNPFFFTRNIGPIYPVYMHNMSTGDYVLDANGNRIWDFGNHGSSAIGIANGIPNRPSGGFGGRDALAEAILNDVIFRRTAVSGRWGTDISFLKYFKFTNNVAIDFENEQDNTYENTQVGDGAPGGRSQKDVFSTTNLVLNQLLNYSQNFGRHHVDALLGHESLSQTDYDVNGFKQGQSLSGNTELGNFTTINSTGSSVDNYRVESYFSRVNYDYKNKYYLQGSIRRDGNSKFAKQSRWGTFWSVGASWRIEKESFMQSVPWVDLLKLRSSYGGLGNAGGISRYAYQGLYGFANNANEPGIVQSQTSFLNLDLTWETNTQFDAGVDFSLFKSRVNGSIEYYNRISSNLLFAVPQPLSSGALSVNKNTATMYNKGIELQVNGDIIRTKNFTWNTGINLSTVKNRITKMPDGVTEFITGTKKYAVGTSIYDYWLRSYYGVDPADGAALYVAQNTAASASRRLITNKSGIVDTVTTLASNGKFEFHGSAIPDYYGSLTQTFSYKDFTLTALFTFQKGGETFDANYQGLMSSGTFGGALHTDILRRWQNPGDITDVPRMDNGRTTDFNATSSRWLVDASYFNIRNVSLSYNLPKSVVSRLKMSSGQVLIGAENLAFFSKRKGLNNQQAFSGVTSNAYPPARIITAGLTFNL